MGTDPKASGTIGVDDKPTASPLQESKQGKKRSDSSPSNRTPRQSTGTGVGSGSTKTSVAGPASSKSGQNSSVTSQKSNSGSSTGLKKNRRGAKSPGTFFFERGFVEAGGDYVGMYRNIRPNGVGRLAPQHKAFARFHPWRPKKNIFTTSGYYFDMDMGGLGYGLRPEELMIHNVPPGTKVDQIKSEFPSVKYLRINSDGTVRMEFENIPAAEWAYYDSKLVKLGNRHLVWRNPDEVYVIGAPPEMNVANVKDDYPRYESVTFVDYPGARRTAVIKFRTVDEADQGYEKSPYKKIGNHQNLFEREENPLRVYYIPPYITSRDLQKKFPKAQEIRIDRDSGQAIVRFDRNDDARRAYNEVDLAHLGRPKLGWLTDEEFAIENIPSDVSEDDFFREFPTVKEVMLHESDDGKQTAILRFQNEEEQRKAYVTCRHRKLGPKRRGYAGSGPIKIEKFKPDPNAQLKVKFVPKGVLPADIKKKFPLALEVKMVGPGKAVVQFRDPDDAQKAYDESDMAHLKAKTLGYLNPNQIVIERIPTKLNDVDIRKQFPTSDKIAMQPGDDGKKVVIIDFSDENVYQAAVEKTFHPKIGPQRLVYDARAAGGADPEKQVQIQNIPKEVTESDLKKRFPKAIGVQLEKGGTATISFRAFAEVTDGYKNSGMPKLGNRNLVYLQPNELAVENLPEEKASNKKIKKHLPKAKHIDWVVGPDSGIKVAIVSYKDASARDEDFENTKLPKIGPQRLDGSFEPEEEFVGMDDLELAKTLWKLSDVGYSNISNLFSVSIKLTKLPATTKGVDLLKMFNDCKKCDFNGTGRKRAAILEFDNPRSAAKGYSKARSMKIEGKKIKVEVVPIVTKKVKKPKSSKSLKSSKSSGKKGLKK